MNTTYKKITLDYLIRVIRAISQGEKLEFSTSPYDGGLNYTILHTSILGEDYVAVVAPSICEKAFLVYGPDICGPFWEDDFKDLLMSLPLELGLDPDGCPYVKTEELEHFLQQHPELAPTEEEAWDWHDEEDVSPEELTMLKEHPEKLKDIPNPPPNEPEPEQKPVTYAIDFGGNVMAKIEIENGEPKVLEAMEGYGNAIDRDEIRIHKLSN